MNMTDPELAGKAERLRVLVAEGRYQDAQECFEDYCGTLKETLRRLPAGDPRRQKIDSEWRRLLEQTRRRVLAGQAHAAARLARLPRRRPLYNLAPVQRRTWDLLG
jgi:hypothetical protein